jgi:hypothetical protein
MAGLAPDLFHALVAGHIVAGTVGLVAFWPPVVGKKGGRAHRLSGKVFTYAILVAAVLAVGMSLLTVAWPMETHPHLVAHADFHDPMLVRGVFGWMMLYLAILTINLAWYGMEAVRNRADHAANGRLVNVGLQHLVAVAAANSAIQGWLMGHPLMGLASIIGFATAWTNLRFIRNPAPARMEWQREHLKALVGAGISVYTAFFAFGSVRLMPALALSPVLWSIPLSAGLGIIFYQWWVIDRRLGRPFQLFTGRR